MAINLTAERVKTEKPDPAKRREIGDAKVPGLWLVIQPSGAKSWALRYRFNGKPKKLTIGPMLPDKRPDGRAPAIGEPHSLADARTAAQALKVTIARGTDPAAKPDSTASEVAAATVRKVAERFYREHRKKNGDALRDSTRAEIERQFEAYILPSIGDRPIAEVTGDELVRLVDVLTAKGARTMANRVHATLSVFFGWCCDRRRKILLSNPYAGFSKPNGETKRSRALSWAECAALWQAAGEAGQPFGPIVRLLLLTGQRRSEVTGIMDREIDRNRALWTIPASRAKNGEAHTVPLTAPALAELDSVRRIGKAALVFSTNGEAVYSGHQKAKDRLDAQMQFNAPWRLHDIRRTVATGMAELGEPVHVVEAVLNHKSGTVSGIAAVYNVHTYAEEKRHALEAWGRFISDVVTAEPVRLAYERLSDRRRFRDAIHGPEARWRRYVALLARWNRFCEHVTRQPPELREAA